MLLQGKSSAQSVLPCDADGFTPAQREAILDSLQGVIPSGSPSSPWKISLWVYMLRFNDGSVANYFQNFNPENNLPVISQHYSDLFEFVICGVTTIDSDEFAHLTLSSNSMDWTNLKTYVAGLNNPLAARCVPVFIVGGQVLFSADNNPTQGYAVGPVANGNIEGVFVTTSDPVIWSHEIGHYFGLPHTFHGFQYVNSPVVILGESYSCYQTGDGFCDTPADFDDCSLLPGSANCIPFTCSYTDPLGVNFQPDPTLLMSYYEWGCRNRFSAEQKQFMRTLYLLHPAYEPIRNPHPDCIQLKYGLIERECVYPGVIPI